jgi:hypothetical protein
MTSGQDIDVSLIDKVRNTTLGHRPFSGQIVEEMVGDSLLRGEGRPFPQDLDKPATASVVESVYAVRHET